MSCSTLPSRTVSLSPETDLNAIRTEKSYSELKDQNSVVETVKFGQDPEHLKWRFDFAKRNINFDVPERKIIFKATLWDITLIKTYLDTQNFKYGSTIEHELRAQLMADHREFTQFLLGIDSYINAYFHWSDWTIWLEDKFGRSYFPVKTKESSEVETIAETKKQVLGKQTITPQYTIQHDYGTLYFKRLNLPELSPVKLVLLDQEEMRRIELGMKVEGKSPEFPPVVQKVVPVLVQPPTEPELTEEERRKQMRIHFSEATRLYKEEKFEQAIQEWQKVLELDPNHELSKIKIEKASQFVEEPEPPEPVFSEKQTKRQKQVHFLLATEHYRAGEYEAAINEWKEVLKLDPEHQPSIEKIEKARQKLEEL